MKNENDSHSTMVFTPIGNELYGVNIYSLPNSEPDKGKIFAEIKQIFGYMYNPPYMAPNPLPGKVNIVPVCFDNCDFIASDLIFIGSKDECYKWIKDDGFNIVIGEDYFERMEEVSESDIKVI